MQVVQTQNTHTHTDKTENITFLRKRIVLLRLRWHHADLYNVVCFS